MDKAEKITSAILDRVVRQGGVVDRQHDKKASSIADAAEQRQMRTGGHAGAISGAFERLLSSAPIVEIEAIHRARSRNRIEHRKIFVAIWGRRQNTLGCQGLDLVIGETIRGGCPLV